MRTPKSTATVEPVDVAAGIRLVVARLHRLLRQQSDVALTPTKQTFLATIGREGPLTLGELAAAEQVAPPSVTKVVGELERLGLVHRETDERDRRVTRVEVTPEGHRLLDQVRTRRTAWLTRQLDELDPASLAKIAAALPVLEQLAGTRPRPDSG